MTNRLQSNILQELCCCFYLLFHLNRALHIDPALQGRVDVSKDL